MSDTLIIGIAGGTGSGKTTITKKLLSEFGSSVSVLYHDNYYKEHHNMSFEERSKLNYDHPDSFDTDLLIEDLKKLKKGEKVLSPVYDYTIHDRSDETTEIVPNKVIIVEGILIFENKELCDQFDIKIFVDADADERILRRILRDVNERARSLDTTISQYRNTVKPMHELYVEPSKKNADIIIPNGGFNIVALDMIIDRVKIFIEEKGN